MMQLSADSEMTVKSGAELLDRLIKDVVSELSTTYVSPYQQPLNPLEHTDQHQLDTPASLPRNTAFSLPRFIPLLSQRIYVRNSNARQYLVSWIVVLDSIPDLELVSFLPEFLDGLLQCLSDPSVDVRTSVKCQLADFLQEIRQAAAAAAEIKCMQESNDKANIQQGDGENDSQGDEHERGSDSVVNEDSTSTATTTATTTAAMATTDLLVENDGQGKGTYIPGQGIVVQYARIVEILVPHLSSTEEDIQRTALEWINEFTVIAKDVIIQFTPEIIKAVLPSLAHPVPVIHEIAIATNQSLQKLVLEAPVVSQTSIGPTPTTTNGTIASSTLADGSNDIPTLSSSSSPPPESLQFRKLNLTSPSSTTTSDYDHHRFPVTESGTTDPFDYQATLANLRLQFLNEHEDTRVASLEWLLMLHKKAPHKVSRDSCIRYLPRYSLLCNRSWYLTMVHSPPCSKPYLIRPKKWSEGIFSSWRKSRAILTMNTFAIL